MQRGGGHENISVDPDFRRSYADDHSLRYVLPASLRLRPYVSRLFIRRTSILHYQVGGCHAEGKVKTPAIRPRLPTNAPHQSIRSGSARIQMGSATTVLRRQRRTPCARSFRAEALRALAQGTTRKPAVLRTAGSFFSYVYPPYSTTTSFTITGSTGISRAPVGTCAIASTTSIPSITRPKTGCFELSGCLSKSRKTLSTRLMKN